MKMSSYLSLNSVDYIKGLLMAVLTAVITVVYTSIQEGTVVFNWKVIAMSALSAALAYITKNFLTNSENKILQPEPTEE